MASSIAKNLKDLRGRTTQERLAELSGVPQSAISKYERGEVIPEIRTLLRLAVGLKADVNTLVSGLDDEYENLQAARTKAAGVEDLPVNHGQTAGHGFGKESQLRSPEPQVVGDPDALDTLVAVARDRARRLVFTDSNDAAQRLAECAAVIEQLAAEFLTGHAAIARDLRAADPAGVRRGGQTRGAESGRQKRRSS